MPVVRLREKAEQIQARKRALGITPAQIEAARNEGTGRTSTKRALLKSLADEPRRQRRTLPFAASF